MQHDIASEHVAHTLRCRLGCYHPVNVLALPKHVYSIEADGYIVSESLGEPHVPDDLIIIHGIIIISSSALTPELRVKPDGPRQFYMD